MTDQIRQPNQTLYVSNIDWKIKKPLLKRALYSLFTRYGKVLEVVALRREGLRGQAFVIFEEVQSATEALQAANGFTFFGKDLKIEYANEKSDRISKRDGTYVPKSKRRKIVKESLAAAASGGGNEASSGDDKKEPEAKQTGEEEPATKATETGVPSKILFAQELPEECNSMMLEMLFRQYKGFKEVRIPRAGLAFIEFDDEPHATLALQGLNGFKLTTKDTLNLTYGKS